MRTRHWLSHRQGNGRGLLLGVWLFLAALGTAIGQDDYSTWAHSARIHFNTTPTGANIPAVSAGEGSAPVTMAEIPMLIRLSSTVPGQAALFSQSLATGADLRFADPDGTHLNYQIERWDAAAGKAEIWVLVPKVEVNSTADYITAYWGKPGAALVSDGANVFSGGNYFTGAWHLGEAGTQVRANSVGKGNNAVPLNFDGDEKREGIIGVADSLDGATVGDYLDLGSGFANFTGGLTYTVWAYCAGTGDFERFLNLGTGTNSNNILLTRDGKGNGLSAYVFNGGTVVIALTAPNVLESRKWMQLGFTVTTSATNGYEANTLTIFKNGAVVAQGVMSQTLPNPVRTNNYLGKADVGAGDYFSGMLDEPELSVTPHSAEWMKMNYEIQKPDGKLITWEYETLKLAITSQPAALGALEGATATMTVVAASPLAPITYQWFKDGAALAWAKSATIPFASITLDDAGAYFCRATDGKDTVDSKTVTVAVPEVLSTWGHSRKILFNTLNTLPGGGTRAGTTTNVDDFPLLVRLDGKRLDFSQAGAGGKDIRFADPDGTVLRYQIERWDAQASVAEIWVRVPRIDANSDKDYITLYWGKLTAKAASDPTQVFAKTNGFLSSYPLDETAGAVADRVTPPANGTAASVTRGVPGVIANAYRFTGGSSTVVLPNGILSGLKAFTVSLWAKENTPGMGSKYALDPTLFGQSVAGTSNGDFGIVSHAGKLATWNGLKNGADNTSESAVSLIDGHWHHIGLTYDGALVHLFEAGEALVALPADNIAVADGGFNIGNLRLADGSYASCFVGDIDEVQVANVARSPDWIRLAYQSQRADADLLVFGTPAANPPPPPSAFPVPGDYEGSVTVALACAADNASIFFTLDGTEPDTAARGTTRLATSPIRIEQTALIKAKAVRNGLASPTLSAAYVVHAAPGGGDTLITGRSLNLDPNHIITYPAQDSRVPVIVSQGPAWNPAPIGFDHFGPLFQVAATDTAQPFPGLLLSGDTVTGVFLYRREGGANRWMPLKDGALWIPSAGGYFWGRDTLPPRIRFAGTDAVGADSLRAFFVMEDNVANLRCRLHVRNGSEDSLGWRFAGAGEIVGFTFPLPAADRTPLELSLDASDQRGASRYPSGAGRVFTIGRALPPLTAALQLKAGIKWKLAGFPMEPQSPLSLSGIASVTGSGKLHGVYWNTSSGADGDYVLYGDEDALPARKGFWIGAEAETRALVFPPSRSVGSDSDGLFPISLVNGWNLVTCPALRPLAWPVSPKDGESYLRSRLKGLRGFDGAAYTRPDSLSPWEGYYVWYGGKDTVVRVGPGAGRPAIADVAGAAKASSTTSASSHGLRLGLRLRDAAVAGGSGGQETLELGAAAFATRGIGIEDELRIESPNPIGGGSGANGDQAAAAWLLRDGRALATDYVAWETDRAMSWTVIAQGKPQGYLLDPETPVLPEGYQAWAVSPSRRTKWRLAAGGSIPVTGSDTLKVYAGTPAALAKVADLIRGREEGGLGVFACVLRSVPGGLELILNLPSAAEVQVRLWSPTGVQIGGIGGLGGSSGTGATGTERTRGAAMGAGSHTLGWNALAPGQGPLSQGVYLVEIRARGQDWSARRVEAFGALR